MNAKTAGDLMVPLDEYPVVEESSTVLDALIRLKESRRNMESGRQPFQAVLVADGNGQIIGKLGQLHLLKTLEPSRRIIADQDTLVKAGVSDTIIETALDHMRAFHHDFSELCAGAAAVPVRNVMQPIREHIHIGASISEVIHRIVVWRTLSVLVTEDDRPVGLVRLSDLCDAVIEEMCRTAPENGAED
ncbi:MAG: CBS domain-containing protein [Acidobacteria bacterium]|nr:CBS domain-containing protein [Acidobacteriota bacterium]